MNETRKQHWFRFGLKTFLIATALVSVYILAHSAGYTGSSPVVPTLPNADQVADITAAITWAYSRDENPQNIRIPEAHFATVLRFFSPPVCEELPPEKFLTDVANLRIAAKDGRVTRIRIVFFGKEPARFVINDIACLRGGKYEADALEGHEGQSDAFLPESTAILRFLRAVHADNSEELTDVVRELDRSAGHTLKDAQQPATVDPPAK